LVGKLTRYDRATSSIISIIFDESPYQTPNQALKTAIDARNGIYPEQWQNNRQRTGDLLEPVILGEAVERLGLDEVNTDLTEKFEHPTLPLEASLDGLAYATNRKIKADADRGIYIPESKNEIVLNGQIVMECKCTSIAHPFDTPPNWLGVLQLKSSMNILNAKFGILAILYNSTDLRYYIYEADPKFYKVLASKVLDFDRRIDEEDYYTPQNSDDARLMYATCEEEINISLPGKDDQLIESILDKKEKIKTFQVEIDQMQTQIMKHLGNHRKGTTKNYEVDWGETNFKAKPEKVVPAKEAYTIRNKSLKFKVRANQPNGGGKK
tara:strand:+ start:5145 stop:6116 length:972 start_codon:yes stop_codon:yes gene_type:complete